MPPARVRPFRLALRGIFLFVVAVAMPGVSCLSADPALQGQAFETVVRLASDRPEAVVPDLERLLALAEQQRDLRSAGMLHWALASARHRLGEIPAAIDHARTSEEIWTRLSEPDWIERADLQRFMAESHRAGASYPPIVLRAGFVANVAALLTASGRPGDALRLLEDEIRSSSPDATEPLARAMRASLILSREPLFRELGLPPAPPTVLEPAYRDIENPRKPLGIPQSEDSTPCFQQFLEIQELMASGESRDAVMEQLSGLHRDCPGMLESVAPGLGEVIGVYDLAKRNGPQELLAFCARKRREAEGGQLSVVGPNRTDPIGHLCRAYDELLSPGRTRLDAASVRGVLDSLSGLMADGQGSFRPVTVKMLLEMESHLGDPSGPESWPATEEFLQTLEAAERRVSDLPTSLRQGDDDTLALMIQLGVRLRARAGDAAGAFELAERARARGFLDRLTYHRLGEGDRTSRELDALYRRRADLRQRIDVLEPGPEHLDLVSELADLQGEIDLHFYRRALDASAAERVQPPSLAEIQQSLEDDTTLVAFMDFPEQPARPLIWVLDRHRLLLATYRFPDATLRSKIGLLADGIANRRDDRALAAELYGAFWAPLAEEIGTELVVLVPHGAFQELPFAALLDPATGERLVQQKTLLHAPSASAWVHLASLPDTVADPVLVLGNPTGDLGGSDRSVREIGVLWKTAPLVGEAATEAAFRSLAPGAGLIHVSSHGGTTADSRFNHLRLARTSGTAAGTSDDGRLELHEVSHDLRLTKHPLVVLPACGTGRGPWTRGDEVASLARAFLLAGARSAVTTGWDVEDRATASLMVDFHRHLAAGVEAAAALRRAQVAAIGSQDRSAPWHWAAFSLHGAGGETLPAPDRGATRGREIVLSDRVVKALEVFAQEGEPDAAILAEALHVARTENEPADEAAILWALSQSAIEAGRLDEAGDLASRGREIWERLGDPEWIERLSQWEALAATRAEAEQEALPVLRALFLAELIDVEMKRFRVAEALRQANLALSLIEGHGQPLLRWQLRLYRASARAMLEPSESTLAELQALMEEGRQMLAAERPQESRDVTPLLEALSELMLALSSGNFMGGLEVLEDLAETHGDLLSPEFKAMLAMLEDLMAEETSSAMEWCRTMKESGAALPGPGSDQEATLAFLCSTIEFLEAVDAEDTATVDLTALQVLFRQTDSYLETGEGPFQDPLQRVLDLGSALARAKESGDAPPPLDELRAALDDVEAVLALLPLSRRAILDEVFLTLFSHTGVLVGVETGRVEEAFELAERSRAREFLDLLETPRSEAGRNEGTAREIADLRRHTRDLEARIGELDGRDPSSAEGSALHDQLIEARIAISHRLDELALDRSQPVRAHPVPLDEIRSALGENNTTLVMYLLFALDGSDPLAWVIDGEGVELVELDVEPETLAQDVSRFVEQLRSQGGEDHGELAERLYSSLWRPLRDLVGTRRVVLVPDGVLLGLPFAALRDPDSGAELIRQASLLYAPSASAWVRLQGRSRGEGPPLVMGDPSRDLHAAEVEARNLAALWETPALIGPVASERSFRERAPGASLVHVASHGISDSIEPWFSYLRLAPSTDGGADPRSDGRLELHEMVDGLDLSGTGLVVLSACRTGDGPTTGGGERASLARGLLLSGARSVVTAAWDVDDRATGALMLDFHRRLAAGVEVAEALRAAQEAALASEGRSHPEHWAAFSVHGAGGAAPSAGARASEVANDPWR